MSDHATVTTAVAPPPPPEGLVDRATATVAALQSAQRLTLISHRSPDGDTIGSTLALHDRLVGLGKQVLLVCVDPLPPNLLFLSGSQLYHKNLASDPGDTIVAIDSSDWAQLGPIVDEIRTLREGRTIITIDHHRHTAAYGDINLIEPAIASTAEIMFHLCNALPGSAPDGMVSVQTAQDLLTGILSDTNTFQNSNSTPHAMALAAFLVACGADSAEINYRLFRARRPQAARLWSVALSTLQISDQGHVASLYVTNAMMHDCHARASDTDGLVDFLTAIEGVDLAMVAKEQPGERVKVSVRTSEAVDAVALTKLFGGGGHRRAAGCDMNGTGPDALEQLRVAYRQIIANNGVSANMQPAAALPTPASA